MHRQWRDVIAPALVVACCVVTPLAWWLPLLGPLREGGRVTFGAFDQYQYSLPHWYYMAWMLGHGALSLWNPYQLSGTPYLAVQNHGMLYPPNWLMLVAGVPAAIRWLMLAHYMLAMGGAYWCARVFGAARLPALLAGVVYAFSGSVAGTGAGYTPPILAAVCWLPALLALTRTLLAAQARWSLAAVSLNYVFRAIRVAAGDHVARLTYRPTLVYVGAAATATSVALLVAVIAVGLWREHRPRQTAVREAS